MIKIRRGCFETNSSSVHAIVINKNKKTAWYDDYISEDDYKGSTLIIKPGYFGWEQKMYFSSNKKASYLITSALLLNRYDEVYDKISQWLAEEKINFKFKLTPQEIIDNSPEKRDLKYYKDFYKKYYPTEPIPSDEELKREQLWDACMYSEISIDHFNIDNVHENLVNYVLESKENLLTYLFGDCFIWTGNDNNDGMPSDDYFNKRKYKVFIKGN